MQNNISYYEILNLSPKASDEDVRRAYRDLAKKFHPDLNPENRRLAELRFRVITEAYAHLKTREKRIQYNKALRMRAENDNKNTKGFFSQIGEVFFSGQKENG